MHLFPIPSFAFHLLKSLEDVRCSADNLPNFTVQVVDVSSSTEFPTRTTSHSFRGQLPVLVPDQLQTPAQGRHLAGQVLQLEYNWLILGIYAHSDRSRSECSEDRVN